MNADPLTALIVIDPQIPYDDWAHLETILRKESPFCAFTPYEDIYSILLYHKESASCGTQFSMLMDRNVFGRVVDLAKGREASQEHILPAAVMAFAQCAGINLEPNLAVMEGMDSRAQPEYEALDIAFFRAADNLHAREFADIALGRARKLRTKLDVGPCELDTHRLLLKPTGYSVHYVLALKMGHLQLAGGTMVRRMSRFLDWMHGHWYWSASATILAALCFSPNPPRSVMKNLFASRRDRALAGLRNAAWDLAYVDLWGKHVLRQGKENMCWLLCSRDTTLRRIAASLHTEDEPGSDEGIRERFCDILGSRSGEEIFARYKSIMDRPADPIRPINQRSKAERIKYSRRKVTELETAVLQTINPAEKGTGSCEALG